MTAVATQPDQPRSRSALAVLGRAIRSDGWTVGLLALLVGLFLLTRYIQPNYGPFNVGGLAIGALPIALAAVAQAIAVISGGIDLSVGSVMALTNVSAAALMVGASPELGVPIVIAVLALGLLIGAINGALIVVTRVPDIIVTLAMLFVWAGVALLVLGSPGGSVVRWLPELITGSVLNEWIPRSVVVLLVLVGVVWIPLRRTRLGLSLYAVGSDRSAAFRSGVNVGATKIVAYALTGFFAAAGGLAITASTGIGTPTPGPYLLLSVAAVVLGGVSLTGGRGGLLGPIVAVFILSTITADLTLLRIDPNWSTVIQGSIMVLVVMIGAYLSLRRARS
jgi:ribose transport system permease protein